MVGVSAPATYIDSLGALLAIQALTYGLRVVELCKGAQDEFREVLRGVELKLSYGFLGEGTRPARLVAVSIAPSIYRCYPRLQL